MQADLDDDESMTDRAGRFGTTTRFLRIQSFVHTGTVPAGPAPVEAVSLNNRIMILPLTSSSEGGTAKNTAILSKVEVS